MEETLLYDKNRIKQLKEHFARPEEREGMSDEELLILLLSFTNVGDDLERVIHGLYADFGSFRRCFLANYTDLMRIDGMTHHAAMLILLTGKIIDISDRDQYVGRKITDFGQLFLSAIKPGREEEFWAAALDENDRLIALEMLAIGGQGSVSVPIGVILRFVTYHSSRRIVVAHSHPDLFEAKESKRDIEAMHFIGGSLDKIGVKLYGQVIVAGKHAKFIPYDPQK